MTRKDYEKIAAVIKHHFDIGTSTSRRFIAQDFADMLAADNPRFDMRKFLDACGVE